MIELYNRPTSTCSQKVRVCLAEKGLEFIDRRVDNKTNQNLTPEYLALNPNGVVPTLVHDGNVITDSSVICEYLDEIYPQPPLTPRDAVERARMRAWMRFAEEVPTMAIRVPSFHMIIALRFEGMDERQFITQEADARPLRKHFYRRMGVKGFSKEDVATALEELDLTLSRMENMLAGGRWLMGEVFTLADILVIPTLDRMADLGLAAMWQARYPRATAWHERVQERDSFRRTYGPGSRLSESARSVRPLDLPLPC